MCFLTATSPLTEHITRFAPSPHGALHVGHIYAAWFASHIGKACLRIDDIDKARSHDHCIEAIVRDLRLIGFFRQHKIKSSYDIWRQSLRMHVYQKALDNLRSRELVYPCFCTRAELNLHHHRDISLHAPHACAPRYSGRCRRLTPKQCQERIASKLPYALRLDSQKAKKILGECTFIEWRRGKQYVDFHLVGDQIIARKDIPTSYHLACVIDDAAQDVTLVTRGEDLFESTHIQRVLQELLGLPVPAYCHHPLVCDGHGKRLAKSRGSQSFYQQMIDDAFDVPALYTHFTHWFDQVKSQCIAMHL